MLKRKKIDMVHRQNDRGLSVESDKRSQAEIKSAVTRCKIEKYRFMFNTRGPESEPRLRCITDLTESGIAISVPPTPISRIENGNKPPMPSEKVISELARLLKDDFGAIMQFAGRIREALGQVVELRK